MLILNQKGLAQRHINTHFIPYSSVTLGAGSSTYFGDLADYARPFKALTTLPRWNVSLGYTRQLTPHIAARVNLTWARIVGDDFTYSKSNPSKFSDQFVRNLHFRNDIKEVSLTGIYNFVADGRNPNLRAKFTPYVFLGIALMAHNPEARTPIATNNNNGDYEPRQWVNLQPLHTEGQGDPGYDKPYSLVTIAIPVGVGVRYQLNDSFNIGFEIGFRYTFSDYLDDVAGVYAQPDALQGLPKLMADRRFEYDAARVNTSRFATAQQLFQSDPSLFTTSVRGSSGFMKILTY